MRGHCSSIGWSETSIVRLRFKLDVYDRVFFGELTDRLTEVSSIIKAALFRRTMFTLMTTNRRNFLSMAGMTALTAATAQLTSATSRHRYKAVVFDAFAIFDPRPIATLAEALAPGKGTALYDLWRSRLFDYQWLRAIAGRYADFHEITRESLRFATRSMALDLPPQAFDRLADSYAQLNAWPDAPHALMSLRASGVKLAFLSNMTETMLRSNIQHAGLDGMFENIISTDRIRSYKPDPRGYRLACDSLRLDRHEILFVAFAGWDATGAQWFGFPTFWMNRTNATQEFDAMPLIQAGDFGALLRSVAAA